MEKKQIIISVGRECGSGGRKIAKQLAERLNIQYYDHELIEKVARSANLDVNTVKQIDEKPASFFSGMYIPIENDIAFKEFSIIKKKADDGESFVIVGRCAEHVLRENENLISIFVTGDMYDKKQRIMQKHNVSIEKATDIIIKTDKKRKKYHNYYCDGKWGDSRNYNICINSSKIGIDGVVDVIMEYIKNVTNCN